MLPGKVGGYARRQYDCCFSVDPRMSRFWTMSTRLLRPVVDRMLLEAEACSMDAIVLLSSSGVVENPRPETVSWSRGGEDELVSCLGGECLATAATATFSWYCTACW